YGTGSNVNPIEFHFPELLHLLSSSPNLSNMNSDFTSENTVRNNEIPSSIFVVSEQVLDASAQANIQRAATKITNMDDGISLFRQFCQFNRIY
ncbi:hypothetical protein, partial [Anaerobutyricum hallii]|uniref:hypothetical protein n=1 Tax=Anaerobutyricum hallii TaxID=39488 RepID=UPI0022E36583